jgi:hypothetical protein
MLHTNANPRHADLHDVVMRSATPQDWKKVSSPTSGYRDWMNLRISSSPMRITAALQFCARPKMTHLCAVRAARGIHPVRVLVALDSAYASAWCFKAF